ncbi:hypothetical protein GCM10007047_18900 [Cerasicoccus arenae]|uniref:Uncharacterized protein n=1 Tax=Cerasicoccus arenae TaxID=424488 RepID=A0A8J3DBT6_9BACT|nr:hypothetical protein GCM10007047_18900 [Cerasicoccus arenae]
MAVTPPPAAQLETVVAQASMPESADPHFVVGSFSATESSDPTFTTVAATHYMPTSQRDGVHFAYNAIDSASHATLAMAGGPVRSIY